MLKVGIPRALLYYQYYPLWQAFFSELDALVVTSPPTTQAMLLAGSSRVVSETCLPVKTFLGHVLALVGACDFIFIPAIRSLQRRVYNCSKFLGLPDMTRAVTPGAPPVLEVDIDVNRGRPGLYQAVYRLGRRFSRNPFKVKRAADRAFQAHQDYRALMSRQGLTPPEAIERLTGLAAGTAAHPEPGRDPLTMAVIGHPYLLYDEHISHRIIERLEKLDCRVSFPEMLTEDELARATDHLGPAYWTYEGDVVGAGGHYLGSGVDGVIGLMPFGCGPDSLMMEMVRRQAARQAGTPFMCLTMEEHTAETGIVTRLEAFRDMVARRKRNPRMAPRTAGQPTA